MINGLTFDIEDWFQVENLRSFVTYNNWNNYELRVEKNVDILLNLLEQHNKKATFFILGWIAERAPQLVRKIARNGHEIASHGYKHEIVYKLKPEDFEEDVRKSKIMLEDIAQEKVIGYRAPNFSITKESLWAIDILAKLGFKYDSSIFPTSFHDRYGLKGSKIHTFRFENGLTEFPLTTYRISGINMPIAGGGYFRLIPYRLFKFFLNKINSQGHYFIFYLHPWEIDNMQPRVQRIKLQHRFRHYINLHKTYGRLECLLKDFRFDTLRDLL